MTRSPSDPLPVPHVAALDRLATDLGPGPAPDEVALAHLALLLPLVPADGRRAFLFACWCDWTRQLSPARRAALSAQGDAAAAACHDGVRLTVSARTGPAWRRYLADVRAAVARDTGGPANYLVFRHAALAQPLLGLPAGACAVAAWALRAVADPTVCWVPADEPAVLAV